MIVDADANLEDAVERIVFGAFYQSGQSCIGVQRVIAHESISAEFKDRLAAATSTSCSAPGTRWRSVAS